MITKIFTIITKQLIAIIIVSFVKRALESRALPKSIPKSGIRGFWNEFELKIQLSHIFGHTVCSLIAVTVRIYHELRGPPRKTFEQ